MNLSKQKSNKHNETKRNNKQHKKTKKYKKYKKTKQTGGANSAIIKPSQKPSETFYLRDNKLDSIIKLFQKTFDVRPTSNPGSLFHLNKNLKDNFLQGEDTNFYEWYKSKNPDYKNISDLTTIDASGIEGPFKLPEFETLVANIAKDILLMILQKKFNNSNETEDNKQKELIRLQKTIDNYQSRHNNQYTSERTKKIYSNGISRTQKNKINYERRVINPVLSEEDILQLSILLERLNKIISDGYIYREVQRLYLDFLQIVSLGHCDSNILEILEIYIKTPIIILPSHYTIDFKTVVNLCSVPIINFKLFNRRRLVHNYFLNPCNNISHDIELHGNVTHNYKWIIQNQNKNKEIKNFFEYMKIKLDELKQFYNYNEDKIKKASITPDSNKSLQNYNDLPIEIQKLCIGIILFYVLHENVFIGAIFDYFIKTNNKYDKRFFNINLKNISDDDDDPNNPTSKYPLLKKINWKSAYFAFLDIIFNLDLITKEYFDEQNSKLSEITF